MNRVNEGRWQRYVAKKGKAAYNAHLRSKYKENPATKRKKSKANYAKKPLAVKKSLLSRLREERETRMAFLRWLKELPCQDCHRRYPSCAMDFDHRDPTTKKGLVSRLIMYKPETCIEEIKKCDLVCANCHRIRHNKASSLTEEAWAGVQVPSRPSAPALFWQGAGI